jgi:hypothetical protein
LEAHLCLQQLTLFASLSYLVLVEVHARVGQHTYIGCKPRNCITGPL